MKLDYREFSHQLDGHWDHVLAQYGIELPQMRGINSKNGECPLCGGDDRAHWRDVDGRLCLFCRNCAADSMHPPENVIMEYAGISFGELVKDLADYVNHVPIERVKAAQKRVRAPKFNLPADDKRNTEKATTFLSKCVKRDILGAQVHELDGEQFLPIHTFGGELVNVARIGRDTTFIAGGISYGAYTTIQKNDSTNYLVVAGVWNGRIVAEDTGANVLIAYSAANIKYICLNAPESMKCKPVLTIDDAQADMLCDEMAWLLFDEDSRKITKMKKGQQLGDSHESD